MGERVRVNGCGLKGAEGYGVPHFSRPLREVGPFLATEITVSANLGIEEEFYP